jgi:hypothetical protein
MQEQAIIVRAADELMESETGHEGAQTFLTIRVISLPAAVMLTPNGYR